LIATIILIREMDERSTGPPDQNGKFGDVYGYILPIQALCLSTTVYHQGLWSLPVELPSPKQGEEDDTDKVLEKVHHDWSN
jgi:hypothetical protein